MVAAMENDSAIHGFERERCIFQNRNDTRLPLSWDGKATTALAGRLISLRFYFRDAAIYAIGTG